MPRFTYQVRDARGLPGTGVVNAASAEEAFRLLRGEGQVVLDLHEQPDGGRALSGGAAARKTRVRRDEVIFFANQLAVMVDTGVPLPDALDCISEQSHNEVFRAVVQDICEQVKAGMDFSAALARYPRVFGNMFVSLVKASEASGTMGKMLQRIARYIEQQRQVRKRVKGAVAYPVALLGFCVGVVVAMLTFVLPRFEKIYAGRSAVLPAPTRILLAASNGLVNYWMFILGGLIALVTGLVLFCRTPRGKVWLDGVRLNSPILGRMFRRACLARSLRTLATMISSGVSMLESLLITADVSGNVYYHRMWSALCERLRLGASLSEEMRSYPLMPRSVAQMVAAGERTGKLGTVLDRVAGFCEEDLDITTKTATSFIEPAMIIVMGGIVGGIAMALLLPVFTLSRVVAK